MWLLSCFFGCNYLSLETFFKPMKDFIEISKPIEISLIVHFFLTNRHYTFNEIVSKNINVGSIYHQLRCFFTVSG